MNAQLHTLAEHVWTRTLPALRRRRRTRHASAAAAIALAVGLLAVAALPGLRPAASDPPLARPATPPSPSTDPPSLVILIVESGEARFAQLCPDEITDQGLAPNFSLEHVITGPLAEFY